jgi:hypothetical protein
MYVPLFNITQNDVLRACEKVDGREWSVVHEHSADILALGRDMVQGGDYNGTMHLARYIITKKAEMGRSPQEELWNEKLGLERDDLEEVVNGVYIETTLG